ncbi:hypothetical protein ACQSSU_05295 [Micromonospora echinospora]
MSLNFFQKAGNIHARRSTPPDPGSSGGSDTTKGAGTPRRAATSASVQEDGAMENEEVRSVVVVAVDPGIVISTIAHRNARCSPHGIDATASAGAGEAEGNATAQAANMAPTSTLMRTARKPPDESGQSL